ncbi:MAG: TRAP transporter small permease [Burkholderiales bacterium]|nr:TRAP transporter small permease [Burkholderiales bacterium]
MKRSFEWLCGALAALALFAIAALTLLDVLGRKLASQSIPGSLELTEMLMVVVIFAALPLVSWTGEHVVFDSLDTRLPPAVRRWQERIIQALCTLMLGGIAWLMWGKAGDMAQYGDVTAQLKVPQGPFVYAMSVLCGITAAVHAVLMFRRVA